MTGDRETIEVAVEDGLIAAGRLYDAREHDDDDADMTRLALVMIKADLFVAGEVSHG